MKNNTCTRQFFLFLLLVFSTSACHDTNNSLKTGGEAKPEELKNENKPLAVKKEDEKSGPFIDMINIRAGNIEVPPSSAETIEKLWNYLDEEPVALKSKVLGLNGIRVGLGTSETWPEIEKIVKKLTKSPIKMTNIQSHFGQPSPLVIHRQRPVQTIFQYSEDRLLEGDDYPPGDNILMLFPIINKNDKSAVRLLVQPQIRTTRHYRAPITKDGYTTFTKQPRIYPFPSMRFELVIPRGNFLVIGAGAGASRPSSVGHHFLTNKRKGILFEILILLRPEAVRVELKTKE